MNIHVTQEHICEGCRRNCERCPIARAISEALGEPVNIGTEFWWRPKEGYRRMRVLPLEACEFIRAFDTHQPVKPFTFNLDL